MSASGARPVIPSCPIDEIARNRPQGCNGQARLFVDLERREPIAVVSAPVSI